MRITTSFGAALAAYVSFAAITAQAQTVNQSPTISGTPATALYTNTTYDFRPTASDADSTTLAFSISNRPSWATFNTTTGQLSGTPTASQVGSYGNIVIS